VKKTHNDFSLDFVSNHHPAGHVAGGSKCPHLAGTAADPDAGGVFLGLDFPCPLWCYRRADHRPAAGKQGWLAADAAGADHHLAALFSPLRRWVQNAIDRRFYRAKYDAQLVLARFAQVARQETDLDNLSGELLTVVYETFQPQSVGLWTVAPIKDPPRHD
jgi:hypothetical protein